MATIGARKLEELIKKHLDEFYSRRTAKLTGLNLTEALSTHQKSSQSCCKHTFRPLTRPSSAMRSLNRLQKPSAEELWVVAKALTLSKRQTQQ